MNVREARPAAAMEAKLSGGRGFARKEEEQIKSVETPFGDISHQSIIQLQLDLLIR